MLGFNIMYVIAHAINLTRHVQVLAVNTLIIYLN